MSTLATFQDDFACALGDQETALPPGIAALVRQPGFAVYRNTIMKGCIDALQANYPAVARLVGEEWFRAAAALFVRRHPPSSPTLLHYGTSFPAFLEGFEPANELPYLPAVARLDRLWTEAHAARDEAPLSAATMAALSPGQLETTVLRPHAAARWAYCEDHPAFSIWQRNRAPHGEDTEAGELDWQAEGALITRPGGGVQWMALDAAGCAFLDACADNRPLAEAAVAALAVSAQTDLAQLMASLLPAGAFAGMSQA